MGLLPLSYRRPAYVEKPATIDSQASLQDERASSDRPGNSLEDVRSTSSGGIPSALSFDRIMEGGTCPPCTIRDFMNYLIYIERSAENLQFLLWYREYEKRFAEAKTSDLALAPEWSQAMEDEAIARIQKEQSEKARKPPEVGEEILKGTDFETGGKTSTTPQTSSDHNPESAFGTPKPLTYTLQASQAFASAGVKAPFTIQPFRRELDRIVSIYLSPLGSAPRQLNLSDRELKAALHALSYTTHPSALRSVARAAEAALRQQAHPNFIRWSICNGNPPRITFAMGLGLSVIGVATAIAVVLVLSGVGRGWRAMCAVGWMLGFATLMAAYKGMCVVLHGLHHRHVRPWELFVSDIPGEGDSTSSIKEEKSSSSFDSFGSSNSYEDEPWVIKYHKRNVIRKIFDREVWIEEPALRQIQDTIFVQSLLFALLCSGVLVAVFVAVPGAGLF